MLSDVSLIAHNKILFEKFSTQIQPGKRILIIGNNGTGKSTLLKIIQKIVEPTYGQVNVSPETIFGYVPQIVIGYQELSGGQRFNKALSSSLSMDPDVLCLDEPTNHLDLNNKRSLINMLRRYTQTLIIVSHDPDLLALNFDEIWHIKNGRISIFHGNYGDYLKEHEIKQQVIVQQREELEKEKRKLKKRVQEEHKRAAKSRGAHKDENDRNLLGAMKEKGSHTTGKAL